MKLEFDDLDQLNQFAYNYVRGLSAIVSEGGTTFTERVSGGSQTVSVSLADIPVGAYGLGAAPLTAAINPRESELDETQTEPEAEDGEPVTFDPIELPETEKTEAPAPEAPKRKRRTKAEIAADEAATKAATPGEGSESQPDDSETEQSGEGEEPKADPVKAIESAAATDAAAIASEYTDEVLAEIRGMADMFGADRKAHLDEGRAAIQTKGWIPYMATFKGIGQSPNIATYNDDEVKLHRAAIARLLAS